MASVCSLADIFGLELTVDPVDPEEEREKAPSSSFLRYL